MLGQGKIINVLLKNKETEEPLVELNEFSTCYISLLSFPFLGQHFILVTSVTRKVPQKLPNLVLGLQELQQLPRFAESIFL